MNIVTKIKKLLITVSRSRRPKIYTGQVNKVNIYSKCKSEICIISLLDRVRTVRYLCFVGLEAELYMRSVLAMPKS